VTRSPVTVTGSPTIPNGGAEALQGDSKATGLFMSSDHRYWMNGKGPMPSVTTILRVLDKPALSSWYKRQVAEAAVLRYDEWKEQPAQEAVRWLMSMPDGTRDNAAAKGTAIHGLVDLAGRQQGGAVALPVSPEYLEAMNAFAGFLGSVGGPTAIVSSEKAILNLSEGYAGTFDLLMQIPNNLYVPSVTPPRKYAEGSDLWLIDVKTGKGVYPDYALQLAAYGMAEHIALPNDPSLYPFPTPSRYGVLHLRPEAYPGDGYRLIEYTITDKERLAFLAACELWRWMQEHK
jgi:hypothetical protein